MDIKISRTMKKYGGNITAAFGADLWNSGVTGVPNLLLKFYKVMGLSDIEMMLLIQMLRLRSEEKDLCPSAPTLAQFLSGDIQEIQAALNSLKNKGMLAETPYYDEVRDDVLIGYDFEPLFVKLSDYWACARVKEIEKTRKILEEHFKKKDELGAVYQAFENEFGRPLSSIEIEKIEQWNRTAGPVLVQEALRRAVLSGKRNFRYIDSIILDWLKNNLRTLEEIEQNDRKFKESQVKGRSSLNIARNKDLTNNETEKKKRELINQLYMR